MITATFVIACLLFILVLGWRLTTVLRDHVIHFLPPMAIANLAKELNGCLAAERAIVERMRTDYSVIVETTQQVKRLLGLSEMLHDTMSASMRSNIHAWIQENGEQVLEGVLRDASRTLSNHLEAGLIDRTTKLGGEYVLLQELDALDVSVSLKAQYVSPEDIRNALIRLVCWTPTKVRSPRNESEVAEWLVEQTKNQRDLDLLLGKLGVELWNLRWNGTMSLKNKQTDKVAVQLSSTVPNTPREESPAPVRRKGVA